MDDPVYIVGIGVTPIGKHLHRGFTDLVREAYEATLKDAAVDDPHRIERTWFSSTLIDFWGQRSSRGQAVLNPLMVDGSFPNGNRITNVEAGCASGSVAFNGAWSAVRQGADLALAVGVEKMHDLSRPGSEILRWIEGAGNMLEPDRFWAPFQAIATECGVMLQPDSTGRSIAMDAYAMLAQTHMRSYGTTARQIAAAAAKGHTNGVRNPRAQYRFPMTVDEVLEDRALLAPLTRAMCAPRGDAAAAVLVCSRRYLQAQPPDVRRRALRVRAHAITGGLCDTDTHTTWEKPRAPVRAAAAAYEMAGLSPQDLDLVELHDAVSFAEIHLVEDLGLCERGEGGPFAESGATAPTGTIPVNPSGGLVSRGHPIGATGIIMLNEIALQLRGQAGEVQLPNPRIGLAENAGGFIGLDVATCAVTILERAAA